MLVLVDRLVDRLVSVAQSPSVASVVSGYHLYLVHLWNVPRLGCAHFFQKKGLLKLACD